MSCGKVLDNFIYLMKYCHPVNSKMFSSKGKCVFLTHLPDSACLGPALARMIDDKLSYHSLIHPIARITLDPIKLPRRGASPSLDKQGSRVPPSSHLCKIKLRRTRGIPKRMQDAINLQCVGHLLGVVARSLTHSLALR